MKKKIITRFSLLFITVSVLFLAFETYNMRKIATTSALGEAKKIAEVVKTGLTSHMLNGTMDKRSTFINAVTSMKDIESLWIIRGDKVTKQFGAGNSIELPRDEIDKKVLQTGQLEYELYEKIINTKSSIRFTIPYTASNDGRIDCLQCHDVKYGDVLGAVSIILDISHIRQIGQESIYLTIIASIVLILLITLFSNNILRPYLATLGRIGYSVKNGAKGKFYTIDKPSGLTKGKEADLLVDQYNFFVDELQTTFDDIDNKLKGFTGQNTTLGNNCFYNARNIINNLADIYSFKKQVEIDTSVDEIYSRIGQILENKFDIHSMNIAKYNLDSKTITKVYSLGTIPKCCDKQNDFNRCRAYKTSQDIYSVDNQKACSCFESEDQFFHYCMSIKLMDNITLIIQLLVETKEQLTKLRNSDIVFIKKYLEEAVPALEVKYLIKELNESAYRDALTGLHNRKFFEEEMEVLVPLAVREKFSIAVLMLDLDHFKAINDEHGHDIGDKVLQTLSSVIKSNIREADIAIRMGGEEFLVLLIDTDEENAIKVANKIRLSIAKTEIPLPNGDSLFKTVSTGISIFNDDSANVKQVLKNADIALYEAKNTGRNKVVRWNESQTSTIDLF